MHAQARSVRTVRALAEEFLHFSEVRGRSPTTMRDYRRIFEKFFLPSLGDLPIDELTPYDLDRLYTRALSRKPPMASTSVKKYHAVMSVALSQAVRWGWIPANPARLVSLPAMWRSSKVPPSPDEVARLIHACTLRDPLLGAFVLLAAITGCRRGEVAALRWSDVEPNFLRIRHSVYIMGGSWRLKSTKSSRERSIGLGPQLKALLQKWKVEDAKIADASGGFIEDSFVFSGDPLGASPVNINTFSGAFRKVADSLGLNHLTLHDMRHFAATQLVVAGANVRDIADRMGHSNAFFTLNQYVHGTDERQQLVGALAETAIPVRDNC